MFSIREPAVGTVPALYLILTEITYGGKTIAIRRRAVTHHVAGCRCDLTILSKVVALINTTRV